MVLPSADKKRDCQRRVSLRRSWARVVIVMSLEEAEEEEGEGGMKGGKELGSLRTRRLGLEGLPGKRERKPVSIVGKYGLNWTMKTMTGPFLSCDGRKNIWGEECAGGWWDKWGLVFY